MISNNFEPTTPDELAVVEKLKPLMTLLGVVGPFIGILNFLSQIVAGIWLAILGEWGAVMTGLGLGLLGNWILGFALLPSLLFIPLQTSALERGNSNLLKISTAVQMGYTMLVASIWCCWIFVHLLHMTHHNAILPTAFWAYSVATTPWVFMASKERDNISTMAGALFIQVCCMMLIVGFLLLHLTFWSAVSLTVCCLLGCSLYQSSLALQMLKLSKTIDADS